MAHFSLIWYVSLYILLQLIFLLLLSLGVSLQHIRIRMHVLHQWKDTLKRRFSGGFFCFRFQCHTVAPLRSPTSVLVLVAMVTRTRPVLVTPQRGRPRRRDATTPRRRDARDAATRRPDAATLRRPGAATPRRRDARDAATRRSDTTIPRRRDTAKP